jgi:hypothetical protein
VFSTAPKGFRPYGRRVIELDDPAR